MVEVSKRNSLPVSEFSLLDKPGGKPLNTKSSFLTLGTENGCMFYTLVKISSSVPLEIPSSFNAVAFEHRILLDENGRFYIKTHVNF
jgi:hypothetical protein